MLKQKIKEDMKSAVKERNSLVLSTLRMLLAAISNKEKEKRYKEGSEELTEEETVCVIISEAKKRKEAASEYEKGGRPELAEKEKQELQVLKKYMPEQMSEEELKKTAEKIIEEIGAAGPKDTGKVMQELMKKVKGRADGALAGKIVREFLSK